MEKEYKATTLDMAVHATFNDLVDVLDNERVKLDKLGFPGYIDKTNTSKKLVPKIIDVLLKEDLILFNGTSYSLGGLGIQLAEGDERYLGHQRRKHEKEWELEQDRIMARQTNISSKRIARLTFIVLAVQVLIQIAQYLWPLDKESYQKIIILGQEEQVSTDSLKNFPSRQNSSTDKPDTTKK